MTDWQSRVAARLDANREVKAPEPVHCGECGDEVRSPVYSVTRARGEVAQCFECWWKHKVAKGDDKWWTKPEFSGKR